MPGPSASNIASLENKAQAAQYNAQVWMIQASNAEFADEGLNQVAIAGENGAAAAEQQVLQANLDAGNNQAALGDTFTETSNESAAAEVTASASYDQSPEGAELNPLYQAAEIADQSQYVTGVIGSALDPSSGVTFPSSLSPKDIAAAALGNYESLLQDANSSFNSSVPSQNTDVIQTVATAEGIYESAQIIDQFLRSTPLPTINVTPLAPTPIADISVPTINIPLPAINIAPSTSDTDTDTTAASILSGVITDSTTIPQETATATLAPIPTVSVNSRYGDSLLIPQLVDIKIILILQKDR